MSENSSEYLKRTCLICGCHTNQTINIYEPRSGPNIVQLIQAKFKFQPLNEDKYLCFSCNNWLINWHSLQALNSNDAESPSGTFRSHLNSGAGGNVVQDGKKQVAVCRPIAQVRPLQQQQQQQQPNQQATDQQSTYQQQQQQAVQHRQHEEQQQRQQQSTHSQQAEQHQQQQQLPATQATKTNIKINFNKRNFRLQLSARKGRMQNKYMQQCGCGKSIVVRSTSSCSLKTLKQTIQCRKCREFSRIKACYMRSIVQIEKELAHREAPLVGLRPNQQEQQAQQQQQQQQQVVKQSNLVNEQAATATLTTNQSNTNSNNNNQTTSTNNFLPKPSVDGKVVSMLRRLGTTLSRETSSSSSSSSSHMQPQNGSNAATATLPQIMSPSKPKPKWLRPLADDEILVNFDSSISEVLPSLTDQFTHVNSLSAKKRLRFQVSETAEVIDLCEGEQQEDLKEFEKQSIPYAEILPQLIEFDSDEENEEDKGEQVLKAAADFRLPQGLTITLI